ncbi:GyrI-like domain-containing protein [Jeotgalibaca sp. MA1X17-3]|uniref:GyrI-like domain-containing protein n=1 Tax=Jeotgalibaca sp. MA1X17-3 TaxID=2908211 RepID=UPI001F16453F|nr:GyrI-like domain-containing protein [Jeotgalibaca sp. MA1X17-3]UJF15438.1 GyrI-like domain-containing protein [Jeotgalibaca sp. MA1X17-3]
MPRISDFQVIERGPQATLTIYSDVELKQIHSEIFESHKKVAAYIQQLDMKPSGPFFVIYHEFSKKSVKMEAGFPVRMERTGKEDIQPSHLTSGLFLTALHLGPHQEIPKIYTEMNQWLEQNHFKTTGVSEEIYYNQENSRVKENQLVSMVLIPIEKLET